MTIVDTPPIINLNDNTSVFIVIGGSYSAGATATDLVDGDLTNSIITSGDIVDINTSGTYMVTYSVTDTAGNTVMVSQTINVQALISVTVAGLDASNSIELRTNGQSLNFNGDGSASFDAVDNDTAYAILITTQPTSPNQTCGITGGTNDDGSGTINGNNISILVSCITNQYYIGGSVDGIERGYRLFLENNGSDTIMILKDDVFVFNTRLFDLESYEVTFETLPATNPTDCIIENNIGNITGDDVDDVHISCTLEPIELIFAGDFE